MDMDVIEAHAKESEQADKKLKEILKADYNNFSQYALVSELSSLGEAKVIIKRLLDKVHEAEEKEVEA